MNGIDVKKKKQINYTTSEQEYTNRNRTGKRKRRQITVENEKTNKSW